jgi:hypothetical protein
MQISFTTSQFKCLKNVTYILIQNFKTAPKIQPITMSIYKSDTLRPASFGIFIGSGCSLSQIMGIPPTYMTAVFPKVVTQAEISLTQKFWCPFGYTPFNIHEKDVIQFTLILFIATAYKSYFFLFNSWQGNSLQSVHTSSQAHQASYSITTRGSTPRSTGAGS